jgi:hypothetical protein
MGQSMHVHRAVNAAPAYLSLRPLVDLANLWRMVVTLMHPYRPEKHYMRGPGPKWREKHMPSAQR